MLLAYPWFNKDDMKVVEWKYPLTPNQRHKYKVYKDLWEKEYYITSGDKFGGDFLVYPGIRFFLYHYKILCSALYYYNI